MAFNKKKIWKILSSLSNLIGAICLAFSVKIFSPAAGYGSIQFFGTELTMAFQDRGLLIAGIVCLIIGFLIQLIIDVLDK